MSENTKKHQGDQKQRQEGQQHPGRNHHGNRHQHNGNQGLRNHQGGEACHTAYNFVPLANWVHSPDWAESACHDIPFSDGLSGTLDIELCADSPLLVSGSQNGQEKTFFRTPDNRYAIPGTSVRGMIRNVMEIASFSRFMLVDNKQYSLRNLYNKEDYQNNLTYSKNGAFAARALAGWLFFDSASKAWRIVKCEYARVEQETINSAIGSNLDKRNRVNAPGKYRELTSNGKSLQVSFASSGHKAHRHSNNNQLYYDRVENLTHRKSGDGRCAGTLVVTGQPSDKKHMEFVFHSPASDQINRSTAKFIDIPEQVFQGFKDVYGETPEWKDLTRHADLRFDGYIPVFYLMDQQVSSKLHSIGLSQMYKFPYKLRLHDAIQNSSAAHLATDKRDFVSTLFGDTAAENSGGLRSRVSFSSLLAIGEPRVGASVTTVLSSPKPTFYPAYIEPFQNRLVTLMNPKAKLRGWKRYPTRLAEMVAAPPPPPGAGQASQSRLTPLAKGTRFGGKIRFHNLKPAELGALLWTLTWGNQSRLRHGLGMGKPFGFGQVSVTVQQVRLADSEVSADIGFYCQLFEQYMEEACQKNKMTWKNSPQLLNLLAMADPQKAKGKNLTHMQLGKPNQFQLATKNQQALPPYVATPNK